MKKLTSDYKKLLDEVNHKIRDMSGTITVKAAAYTCATRNVESMRKFLKECGNKKYEVLKVKGQWRVYSKDPSFTKEEGMEVLKAIEDTEKKATTTNKEKEKKVEEEKDIIKIVNEIFRNESEHNRRLMLGEEEADRSNEYMANLMKSYDKYEHNT